MTNKNSEIKFEIKEHLGTISTSYEMKNGVKYRERNREINMVSWNGFSPKIDIRVWSPDHNYCGKGVTLTKAEAKELYEILKKIVK